MIWDAIAPIMINAIPAQYHYDVIVMWKQIISDDDIYQKKYAHSHCFDRSGKVQSYV